MLKYFVVWCRERIVVIYRSSLIARGSGAPTFVRAMQKSGFDLRVLRMLLYTASGNKQRSPGLGTPRGRGKFYVVPGCKSVSQIMLIFLTSRHF